MIQASRFTAKRNDWESRFFGREIWSLVPDRSGSPVPDLFKLHRSVDLWECRLPFDASAQIADLVDAGFHICDTASDFKFELVKDDRGRGALPTGVEARPATKDDLPALQAVLANVAFQSRFARPPFGASEAARFYGEWLRNAILGTFDHHCGLLSRRGEILGLVTLRELTGQGARIGLIATASHARGQGVGALLFEYAARMSRELARHTLSMATQATNSSAIRLIRQMDGHLTHLGVHLYLPMRRPVGGFESRAVSTLETSPQSFNKSGI
jgi:dTDP-4-amino-4,6-dideoxy-D-galactose acyltransferase